MSRKQRTGVDFLAVSIGTVHGRMQGKPKIPASIPPLQYSFRRICNLLIFVVLPVVRALRGEIFGQRRTDSPWPPPSAVRKVVR